MEASNPMTFTQFVELLPMAFGEENDQPFAQETLSAVKTLGRASYSTRGGFNLTVENALPEGRCTVRLRANIADMSQLTTDRIDLRVMVTLMQYAISSNKLSLVRGTAVLERQVSLIDMTPERAQSAIAKFCKNCFCALTMLEYAACPADVQHQVRRAVLPSKGVPNPVPEWAQLSSTTSPQSSNAALANPVKAQGPVPLTQDQISESYLFLPPAKLHRLSHLRQSDGQVEFSEHVTDWRTLQRNISYYLGDTAGNVSHLMTFYDAEKTRGFWHQMLNGVDLYFQENPCHDGDGDVSICARLQTLDMNLAGASKMVAFVSTYNASRYFGNLCFDTDYTVTLWCSLNLQSSRPGEVQRTLKEFAAAISDINERIIAMTDYFRIPFCSYIGVCELSRPRRIEKLNEPSFRESLVTTLRDFGEDGKVAGLDADAIQSIDITSLDAATLRDICLTRLTRFNFQWEYDEQRKASKPVLSARKTARIANTTSHSGPQKDDEGRPLVNTKCGDFAVI